MFHMLVEHVKSQDSALNEPTNDESNKKWWEKSEELLGRETEFKRVCLKLLDLYNMQAIKQSQKMKMMKNFMKLPNSRPMNRSFTEKRF